MAIKFIRSQVGPQQRPLRGACPSLSLRREPTRSLTVGGNTRYDTRNYG